MCSSDLLRLTELGIEQWRQYLQGVKQMAEAAAASHAVLVAPSKESVMGPSYHPFAEGSGGPIQQLMAQPEAQSLKVVALLVGMLI